MRALVTTRSLAGAVATLLVGVGTAAGCYNPLSDPNLFLQEHATSGTGGSGGTTTTVDPGCIPNQTGTAIEDACGVFVSASEGSDSNGGKAKSRRWRR